MAIVLVNAPSTFIRLLIHVHPFIGEIPDFDDILVYNKSRENHIEHLSQLFYTLREAKLFGDLKKCVFIQHKVLF